MLPVLLPLSDSHFQKDLNPQYTFIKTIAKEYVEILRKSSSLVESPFETSTKDQPQVRINILILICLKHNKMIVYNQSLFYFYVGLTWYTKHANTSRK